MKNILEEKLKAKENIESFEYLINLLEVGDSLADSPNKFSATIAGRSYFGGSWKDVVDLIKLSFKNT